MRSEFDKNLTFANISFLLEKKKMKIGELESKAEVSTGYISRTRKDRKTKPGIEFIIKAAYVLNVSIDTLLNIHLAALTPMERYLTTFFEKLKKDTSNDQLSWNKDTADELNQLQLDENGNINHPLFILETSHEKGETDYPDVIERIVMRSHLPDHETHIEGDCFNLKMKNGTTLYLMSVSKTPHHKDNLNIPEKEVWMHAPGLAPRLVASTGEKSSISDLVEDLYFLVAEFSKHPRLEKELKYAIDAFIHDDDLSDDPPVDMPFDF